MNRTALNTPNTHVRILHIEDSALIAQLVAKALSNKTVGTYDIRVARTQAEGFAYARSHHVDVVLLDLGLPDSRGSLGVERAREAIPGTPIIVLSADDDVETRRTCYAGGAIAFLSKAQLNAIAIEACLQMAVFHRFHPAVRAPDGSPMAEHYGNTTKLVARALHLHHPPTIEHGWRVAEIAVAIAHRLGLSDQHVAAVRAAGIMHDIGKIALSVDDILDHKGKLSERDWTAIKEHPQASYDVISSVKWPWPVAEIAFQHHERMDGSGYPAGRRGDAIMLEARILAVADAFDARSQRGDQVGAFGSEAALEHLCEGRGSLYDPAVVDACCQLFGKALNPLPAEGERLPRLSASVLVIDDEAAMGRSIERALLGLKGITVTVALDGPAGLKMARRHCPGLILLDIRMPGMSGLDVLRHLKDDSQTSSIPVVILTAVDDSGTIRAALLAQADDYLTKPVRPETLCELVTSRVMQPE